MLLVGKKKDLMDFNRTISLNLKMNNSIILSVSDCYFDVFYTPVANFYCGFYKANKNQIEPRRHANALEPALPRTKPKENILILELVPEPWRHCGGKYRCRERPL